MSNDVLITPASRKIEFKDSSGNVDAKFETDASGNLQITNAGGDISIGDTSADVFIGDGTNNVDIVFEQDGEIRGESGVTLTLGDANTTLRTGTSLDLNNNDITNVASLPANFYSSYRRDTIDSSSEDFNDYLTTGTYAVNNWPESGDTVLNGPTNTAAGNAYGWGVLRVTNWQAASGSSSGTGTYVLQEYWPHQLDIVYSRIMWNGDFSNWRAAWGNENDGPGSGLDADTVDGVEGASFLRSDTTDTASGVITFSNGSNSTSTTSGAVRITGGLGVGYNVHAGGVVRCNSGFVVNTTTVINNNRELLSINHLDMSESASADIDLNRSGFITFYGDGGRQHGIGSRNNTGSASDDIRINTFGNLFVNLDSNSNNTSSADFIIGRHGGEASTMDLLLSVSGEDGDLVTEGNVTAYGIPSDIRLKDNIEIIPNAVEKVQKLDGITFNYKKDGGRSTGLIAQQLQEVLPEVVYTAKDLEGEEHLAVRYGNVVGLLVEALKEQQTQIDNLTTLVNELKEK